MFNLNDWILFFKGCFKIVTVDSITSGWAYEDAKSRRVTKSGFALLVWIKGVDKIESVEKNHNIIIIIITSQTYSFVLQNWNMIILNVSKREEMGR